MTLTGSRSTLGNIKDMTDPVVLVRNEGRVRWLTLNRPERLNAFNRDLAAVLRRELEAAAEDKACGVIVLAASGRAFSTGQDLAERRNVKTEPVDLGAALAENWHPLVRLVRGADKPVVASVNGPVSGAAANLVAACDIVIAADTATFTQPFVRLGIMPDCGGAHTLTRLLGAPRAAGCMLLGEPIDAATAERFGLIWKMVEASALEAATRDVAARLASAAPQALALTKRALRHSETASFEEGLDFERAAQTELGYGGDYAEGISAFFEKRLPQFRNG